MFDRLIDDFIVMELRLVHFARAPEQANCATCNGHSMDGARHELG